MRGHHDGVVDIRHDAEAHVGRDDEHARLDRLAAFDRHRERLPARLERRRQTRVDHTAAVGDDHMCRRPRS